MIFKREPAVLIGLLISILTVIGQALSSDLTWAAAIPLIVGIVTRFFVSPAGDIPPEPAPEPPL